MRVVWAPFAKQVEMETGGKKIPLQKGEGGYWEGEAPSSDYAFFIEGKGPFPDPRSLWQPEGVHGPSRPVDHRDFPWSDAQWKRPPLSQALFYELHVGTFTPEGTFQAILEKLEYLQELGVTHIELMPVAEFSGERGWGYDGVDLYAPYHCYGTPDDLKRLVDGCHRRGLAIVLDVVYNHVGPVGNYLSHFGPYFTKKYSTPWGEAVNLDGPYSDAVRRFFIDNALMWLRDYHFDGLRIDAVHALIDMSPLHFLEQLSTEVKHLGDYYLIAESDLNDPKILKDYGIAAQWNEDFHHAVHAYLTQEKSRYYLDFGTLSDLEKVLAKNLTYDGIYSNYRKRVHGRFAGDLPHTRFIGCLQNHDQIGNRAFGERIGHLLDPDRIKMGAALVLLSPFIPLLFQGEEWAASSPFLYFCDHPELGGAIDKGRKVEFADFGEVDHLPDPLAKETFLKSKLQWDELSQPSHQEMRKWYRSLIALRAKLPKECLVQAGESWLLLQRGSIAILFNFAPHPVEFHLKAKRLLLASKKGTTPLILPPVTVAVFEE